MWGEGRGKGALDGPPPEDNNPPPRELSDPVAPKGHRLLLLPSGPDRVHGPLPHRTEPPRRGTDFSIQDAAFFFNDTGAERLYLS